MKLTAQRVLIFFLLIALAFGFGFAFDGIAGAVDRRHYPKPSDYAGSIRKYADEFGVPEAVIWGVVRTESNFVSSKKADDGSIGLMQLTPERFAEISSDVLHEDAPDAGLLYDPDANLRAGTAYLSVLYEKYGLWNAVYCAWYAGTDLTDRWMSDPDCLNDRGALVKIPDKKCASFVSGTEKAVRMYTELYFET